MQKPASAVTMVVGCVIAVAAMVCSVVLVLADKQTASILSIAGPIIGSLFVASYVGDLTGKQNATLDQQTAKLDTVERQTNGVLDQRIRDGVASVLDERGVIPPAPPAGNPEPPAGGV